MIRAIGSLLLAATAFGQASVKDCSGGASVFAIRTLEFTPLNPVPGENGTLHVIYDVPSTVDAGSSRYTCVLNSIPVFDQKYDLCTQTACPIVAGLHDDSSISAVPNTSGKLVCNIVWSSLAGEQLLCIQMTLKLAATSLRGTTTYEMPKFHGSVLMERLVEKSSSDDDVPLVEPFDSSYKNKYDLLVLE